MEKVYWDIDVDNDLIYAIDNSQLNQPTTAADFVCNNFPDNTYWIERSWRGYPRLCTNLPLFIDQILTIGNSPAIDKHAQNFLGGRPDDRR